MGGCAQDFKAKYRFLGDAAVKEEEENNKEILREMMGSAPQSRREWGAPVTSAVTINDALDRRGRSIKLKQVVQASIKTKTTESWPGDETTYEDLTFEASVTRVREKQGIQGFDIEVEYGYQGAFRRTWVDSEKVEVIDKATSVEPPLVVLRAQILKDLGGDSNKEADKKDLLKLCFRPDPNEVYRDQYNVAARRHIDYCLAPAFTPSKPTDPPWGRGTFPQNGGRIPLFGEPLEVTSPPASAPSAPPNSRRSPSSSVSLSLVHMPTDP